jgi:nitroreductase
MLGVGMAVGAMELAFVECGLASMQAGGFDRAAFAKAVDLPEHMKALSLLAVGGLPEGHVPKTKQRKDLKDIAFRVGEVMR